jgi:hypothetical protein
MYVSFGKIKLHAFEHIINHLQDFKQNNLNIIGVWKKRLIRE